jgi:diguanylate cyclase
VGAVPAQPRGAEAAALAKAALRRLAQSRQDPTPANYTRAWIEAGGPPPAEMAAAAVPAAERQPAGGGEVPAGVAWAALIGRVVRGLERGGKQWTAARRKDSLQRVLTSSARDAERLQQRLQGLLGAWEEDRPPESPGGDEPPDGGSGMAPEAGAAARVAPDDPTAPVDAGANGGDGSSAGASGPTDGPVVTAGSPSVRAAPRDGAWVPVFRHLHEAVDAALPNEEPRATEIAERLAALASRLDTEGATPELAAGIAEQCRRARRLFAHRHHLIEQLGALCRELAGGLVELAEDEGWMQGPAHALQARLAEGSGARAVRSAGELLAQTRREQQRLRQERAAARDALKQLIGSLLSEVGELGDRTGAFQQAVGRHAEAIAGAVSLQAVGAVVQQMLADSREVQAAIGASRQRLQAERTQAETLQARVRELEAELRRLGEEVGTDPLTQVANRRGLMQDFAALSASALREASSGAGVDVAAVRLAVALIDIDNFKRLNDTLGHAAGDQALQSLAAAVKDRLRPDDRIARFGGEEFVLLLPGLSAEEAQQVLARLQRHLSASLFMHEKQEVFVTFSGGVTAWQPGEALELAVERADEALYEAKRTGKNRVCVS